MTPSLSILAAMTSHSWTSRDLATETGLNQRAVADALVELEKKGRVRSSVERGCVMWARRRQHDFEIGEQP